MNKREILKLIYYNICNIKNAKIDIYIEELNENQLELYSNYNKVKKRNVDLGLNINIIYKNKEYNNYSTFSSYNEIIKYISSYLNLILKYDFCSKNNNYNKIKFKKIYRKNICNSKQRKLRILNFTIDRLSKFDMTRVAFYEKHEKIFIIRNTLKTIVVINNFYVKLMINGKANKEEMFDFILSDEGYKNITKIKVLDLVDRFNKIKIMKLNSKSIENGRYDLILSNRCGTIFHEMFGHNLEKDLINKFNIETFTINKKINNDLITYIDDPAYKNLLNLKYNDIGTVRNKKVLIKKGIVLNYLDKDSLRCENYKYKVATRMSNSYLAPVKAVEKFDLTQIKNGIYISKIKSGKLFVEEQKFEINIDCGCIIQNGRYVDSISNLKFIVDIEEFIKKIVYIGNDLNFVPSVCNSLSGNIFVYVGSPTVIVKKIYIYKQK